MRLLILFNLFFILFSVNAYAGGLNKVCGRFYIKNSNFFSFIVNKFDKNERVLICGGNEPGWKDIPENQAKANIKNFLRDEGYFFTEIIEDEKNRLIIKPGKQSQINKITFTNPPKYFKKVKYIAVKGSVLNSESLDILEAWAFSRMKRLGYPCPSLKLEADASTGVVNVNLFPGKFSKVQSVLRETPDNLSSKALDRFHAFEYGRPYNGNLFALTSRRMQASGLVDYSNFDNQCQLKDSKTLKESITSNKKFNYEQRVFLQRLGYSKPRSVIMAFGATTEQFPILKLTWRNALLNKNASSIEANLFLSSIEQSLNTKSYLYVFNNYPRLYFFPEVNIGRFDERTFESFQQLYGFGLGYSHDSNKRTYSLEVKPTYNIEDRIEGVGSQNKKFFSVESKIKIMDHDYEYFLQSPREGYNVDLGWSARRNGLGSDVSSDVLRVGGTFLTSFGGFDPPIVVMGLRFKLATLITDDLIDTPNRMRLYLGGDRDLRGFSRNAINNKDLGFKSTAYVGFETRFTKVLPYSFQPLVFIDYARVGEEANELSSNPFWSVGIGLRWQSPFGALRGTIGKGYLSDEDETKYGMLEESLTGFLSLGQEF